MPLTAPEAEVEVFEALLSDPYNPQAKAILDLEPTDWTRTNRRLALILTDALRRYGHLDASAFIELAIDSDVDPALKSRVFELIGLSHNIPYDLKNILGRLKEMKAKAQARATLERALKDDTSDLAAAVRNADLYLQRGSSQEPLSLVDVSEMIDTEPEPIDWMVPGLLPKAVPGLLASKGGVGKSWLALMMCVAGAVGRRFLDLEDPDDASVCVYFGVEDSRQVVHRRLRQIIRWYRDRGEWGPKDDELLRLNLKIPMVNWASPNSSSCLTDTWPALKLILEKELQDVYARPGLVILDTYARMAADGSDENTVQALRPVLTVTNRICDMGWTSLMLHHVGKGFEGARGKDLPTLAQRLSTEAIRGSSSLHDNHRVVLQLAPILEPEAEKAGLDLDRVRAGDFCVLGQTKSNGAPRLPWRLLEQTHLGVWEVPSDSADVLALLQGPAASTRLADDRAFSRDYKEQVKKYGMPKMDELVNAYCPPNSKNPKNWFKVKVYRLKKAGMLE